MGKNKLFLIGGAALLVSFAGGSLVLGDTLQQKHINAQVISITPTLEPSATPTEAPTDTPTLIPTVKIWPTVTPTPTIAPTTKPKETTVCSQEGCKTNEVPDNAKTCVTNNNGTTCSDMNQERHVIKP